MKKVFFHHVALIESSPSLNEQVKQNNNSKKKKRMFLSPERELKRIQCTPVSHASPDTLRKKVSHSRTTIQTLHKENLKLQRIVSSMSTEQQETVNVDEDFRRLIQSMFQDGHKLESNQKTRMKKIMIDCLNDNLQKGEIPQDQVQSSVDEVVNFMFENSEKKPQGTKSAIFLGRLFRTSIKWSCFLPHLEKAV